MRMDKDKNAQGTGNCFLQFLQNWEEILCKYDT